MKQTYAVAGLALVTWACAHALRPTFPSLFPLTPSWSVKLEAPLDAPLAADEGRVYVATRDGSVQALSAADGSALWRRSFPAGSTVAAGSEGVVVRQPGGQLTRIAPDTGRDLWSRPSGIDGGLPATLAGEHVLVAGEGIAMLNLADGRALWGAPGAPQVLAPPQAQATRVYVVEDGGVLRVRERQTGTPLWSFKALNPLQSAVAVDAARVYLPTTDRRVLTLGAVKGGVRWRFGLGADGFAQPALAGKLLLVAGYDDVLYALDREGGRLVWRTPLPSRPLSAPLILPGAALVACRETEVVAFDLTTGARLGSMKTAAEMRVAPLVAGERLVVGLRGPWTVASLALNMAPRGRPAPTPSPTPTAPAAPPAGPTPTSAPRP